MGRAVRWVMLVVLLCWPAAAVAQDDEFGGDFGDEFGDEEAWEGDEGDGELEGDAALTEPDEQDAEGDATPGSRDWQFGLYYRYQFIPKFIFEAFVEQAPGIGNSGFGVAANYWSDDGGPGFQLGLGYVSYAFEGPVQATGDPVEDTEWLDSDLGMIHVTGSILWGTELTEGLTFQYGIGADLGIVTGSLVRTEAQQDANGNWSRCPSFLPGSLYCEAPQSFPAPTDAYDQDGAHYGVEEERIPPIFPGLMLPHLALRYAPIEDLALKAEIGVGILQYWIGLSAAYAPEL